MVRWDQGLKSAQEPVPGENWDQRTETSGNVGFHCFEMDAAVSDETNLRF